MKRKWPKLFETFVPLYGGRVVLCRSLAEWKQCATYLKKDVSSFPTGCGAHQLFESKTQAIHLVGVFDRSRRTLVHELGHACFRILDRIGIETPVSDANEAYCYLLDALYAECAPHLKAKK